MWDPTAFSKNRERLLAGEVAEGFFTAVVEQAPRHEMQRQWRETPTAPG